MEECKTCKFFEPIGDGNNGYCHRFPPENDGQDTKTIDEFPFVRKRYWCGEHKRKGTK
jgi:hypothetical protein